MDDDLYKETKNVISGKSKKAKETKENANETVEEKDNSSTVKRGRRKLNTNKIAK